MEVESFEEEEGIEFVDIEGDVVVEEVDPPATSAPHFVHNSFMYLFLSTSH